jgi:ribosome assembly protein SQT1
MVATGGMDGRVRVWRRVKRGDGNGVEEWKDWEFLTTLETGSEITVSVTPSRYCKAVDRDDCIRIDD